MLNNDKITTDNWHIYVIFNTLLSDKWSTSINRSIILLKSEHKMTQQALKMIFLKKWQIKLHFLKSDKKSDRWNQVPEKRH